MELEFIDCPDKTFPGHDSVTEFVMILDPYHHPPPSESTSNSNTASDSCSSSHSTHVSQDSDADSLIQILNIPFEKCRCQFDPPCIHNLASTGDLDNLKIYINYDGLKGDEIQKKNKDLCSISETKRTVLHCATEFQGNPSVAESMVDLILTVGFARLTQHDYFRFVNARENNKITALYIAAKMKNKKNCRRLLYAGGDLDVLTNRSKTPAIKIFRKLPSVIRHIILEYPCATFSDRENKKVLLDFGCIMGIPTLEDKGNPSLYEEMDFIANICYTSIEERELILELPIVKILVWLKWQRVKFTFWIARFFQVIWFLTYFVYLLKVYRQTCPFPSEVTYNFTWISISPQTENRFGNMSDAFLPLSQRNCTSSGSRITGWLVMGTALADGIIIEGYPMWVRFRRKWYPMKSMTAHKLFKRFILLLSILHLQKLIFLISIFLNTIPIQFEIDVFPLELQYAFASIGVFLCWFQIFLQIGKIPQLKGYTKMLRQVVYRLSMVGLLYVCLIIAFAMTFCILQPGVGSFASPFEAVFRMSTFLIGEVDFEDRFYGDSASIPASFLVTMTFYGAAILFLHIALLNFLIGLTSIDIRSIACQSKVWETYTYLWQIYLLETFLSRLPFGWGRRYLRKLMLIPQDYKHAKDLTQIKFQHEMEMEQLPKTFRKGLREIHLFKPKSNNTVEHSRRSSIISGHSHY